MTAAAAAVVVTVLTAMVVLLLGQLALPAGSTALGPGRAEASCQDALVYDGVLWLQEKPTAPVVLAEAVDGVLRPPCNDAGQSDRETKADAYRVVGLPDDYLATGTSEWELFRRTDQVYVPAPLGARGVVDVLAIVGVVGAVLVATVLAARAVVRRRRESQVPPVAGP